MKKSKLLLPLILAGYLFNYASAPANADIFFFKNGDIRGDVKIQKISMNKSGKETILPPQGIVGIKIYENKDAQIKYREYYTIADNTDLSFIVENENKKEEIISGKDLEKCFLTKNVVKDCEIVKKYQLIKKIDNYCKKIGLRIGYDSKSSFINSTFYFYNDKVTNEYRIYITKNLELARDYHDKTKMQLEDSFDKENLEFIQECYKERGFDTTLKRITNAGGDLYPEVVKYNVVDFAETLFHERWHENANRPLPSRLNESIANALSYFCTEKFLIEEYGENSNEVQQIRKDKKKYDELSDFVIKYYNKLSNLYHRNISNKEKLKIKKKIMDEMKKKGHDWNNADLSAYIAYTKYFKLAYQVFKDPKDINETIKELRKINFSEEKSAEYLRGLLKKKK